MEDEKSKFLHEFWRSTELEYYFFQEENLVLSPLYQLMSEERRLAALEDLRTQNHRFKSGIQGRNFGDVKHYDVKALTENFAEENLIGTSHTGRLFRVKIRGGHEVTVKTWDFMYPMRMNYAFHTVKFYNELKLLTTEEMKSHKNLMNVIGYSCEKFLAIVYDLQYKQSVRDAIPSDGFDWNARMTLAIEIAHLVESMHDKNTVIGSIGARNIIIDKEGNFKLVEIGLHVGEGGSTPTQEPAAYFLGSYGYFAPELLSATFTIKTDVFAYGILLLELISKKVVVEDEIFGLEKSIKNAVSAGKRSFVDPSFSVDVGVGSKITNLALNCLNKDPAKRPEIGEVAIHLEKL